MRDEGSSRDATPFQKGGREAGEGKGRERGDRGSVGHCWDRTLVPPRHRGAGGQHEGLPPTPTPSPAKMLARFLTRFLTPCTEVILNISLGRDFNSLQVFNVIASWHIFSFTLISQVCGIIIPIWKMLNSKLYFKE